MSAAAWRTGNMMLLWGVEKRDRLHAVALLLVPVRHQDEVNVAQEAAVMHNEGVVEKE